MKNTATLRADASARMQRIEQIIQTYRTTWVGTPVRIVTDFYDQPFGRSKPNLKGRRFVIEGVCLDGATPTVCLAGVQHPVDLDCLEVV